MPRAQAEWKWPGAVIVFSCHLISSQRWFISLEDSKLHKDKTWSVSQGHSTNPFPFSFAPSGYTIKRIALFLAQMKWIEQLIHFFPTLLPLFFISFSISVIILNFQVIAIFFWFSIYETISSPLNNTDRVYIQIHSSGRKRASSVQVLPIICDLDVWLPTQENSSLNISILEN